MQQYQDLLRHIMANGEIKGDRTGTGTKGVFGYQMRFNLNDGFPLVTTKKVYTKAIIHELLWFLKGETNIKSLVDNDVSIWTEWAYAPYLKELGLPVPKTDSDEWKIGLKQFSEKVKADPLFAAEHGDLGPVYGKQWRSWETPDGHKIDQIANAVARLKKVPECRRIIVSAWNPADLDKVALAWCHCFFQFYVANGKLSCQLYQRSCDTFLGVPFNIASYALLTMMIAQVCDLKLGDFVWTGGDTHIYSNHFEQVALQLSREPRALPTMHINPDVKDIFGFKFEDFTLTDYDPHPAIKAPVAV